MPTWYYKNSLLLLLELFGYFVLSLPPNYSMSNMQAACSAYFFCSLVYEMREILRTSGFEAPSKHAVFLESYGGLACSHILPRSGTSVNSVSEYHRIVIIGRYSSTVLGHHLPVR